MPRGGVYRVRNTRLGLKLDPKGLGWALIQMKRPRRNGWVEYGDPLDLARDALRADSRCPLFVYLNDDAYRGTRGHRDGLTREAHLVMVNRIAAELAAEGRDVMIMELE